MKKYFPYPVSKKQASDSGMAFTLILLFLGLFTKNIVFYKLSVVALLFNMIVPEFFKPFAFIWLGLANILGEIGSRVILTVIYGIFVIPAGLIRRFSGKDELQLKKFKKGSGSVMKIRNHRFTAGDLDKPF